VHQNSYKDPQKADVLVYNHFYKDNPDITLPPPREVSRTPIPPEISNTFRMSDEMTQTILGTYDSAMGIQGGNISGTAIANGAMQSNSASMPYIVGYIKGLNRVAQVILDLIPKYYRTPRSLPVLLPNGKRSYEIINKEGSLFMNYDPNSLQVKVEAGVNFAMQKEQALPLFAQFMNTKGLSTLLDNIEIRGVEELRTQAENFQKEMEQQQAQQMQQQQQMASAEMQMKMKEQQIAVADAERRLNEPTEIGLGMISIKEKAQKDAADSAVKERDSETKFIEMMSKVRDKEVDNELEREKIAAENLRSTVELITESAKNMATQTTEEE
jgi:hypothetical protein